MNDVSAANEPTGDEHARVQMRVTALEELLTHTQQTVEELSRELFAQGRRVEALQHELGRIVHKLDVMISAAPVAPRDPAEEKPPHY